MHPSLKADSRVLLLSVNTTCILALKAENDTFAPRAAWHSSNACLPTLPVFSALVSLAFWFVCKRPWRPPAAKASKRDRRAS